MNKADRSSKLRSAWNRVRDSLWFLPSVGVVASMVTAIVAVQVPSPSPESPFAIGWIFGGGAEGARGVLSAIAGSLITVTGVVFSVTIVALQLASSQFTPRVLASFMADRVNQSVLAIFISTFTYTLLVLRSIRSEAEEREAVVPQIAVAIALLLLLVSIGALIVFINHSARSIQASVILERETSRTVARVEALFPDTLGRPVPVNRPDCGEADRLRAQLATAHGIAVTADGSGYLTALHAGVLWSICEHVDNTVITVRMDQHMGAFLFPGMVLATVWPAHAVNAAVVTAVRETFVLEAERTLEQDVEFGLLELADIALRALSPGINDPTTAMHCIDRLGEVLAALGSRPPANPVRRSEDGSVCLLARVTTFDRAIGIAFDQIRYFGAAQPAVALRMLETLSNLSGVVAPVLHAVLMKHSDAVMRQAHRSFEDPMERQRFDERTSAVLALLRRSNTGAPHS